jgi:hypothetical protein
MSSRRVASLVTTVLAVLLYTTESPGQNDSWIGRKTTRSRITLVEVDGSSPKVALDSPRRYSAPEWTPDGAGLIVNGGGKLVSQPTLVTRWSVPFADPWPLT